MENLFALMETLLALMIVASLVLLVIGFISPKTSLFWYKQERTRKKSAAIYGITLVVSFILFGVTSDQNKKGSSTEQRVTEEPKGVDVGQVLHTEYFDIIVNEVRLKDRVNTGNQFANRKPEQGNMYLIINTSFKNTDNESRMLMNGSVWINYNGKDYEFDKAETVMLEGWGLILDQINPLTTKTTNLVYKIPAEIKGDAYWQPGRAGRNQRILLGTL